MTTPILLGRKTINIQSGAGQMIVSQARYLRDRGFDVSVCCAKFGRGAAQRLDGIGRHSLPRPKRLLLSSRLRDRAYRALASRLRRSSDGLFIDHGQSFADADIAYVHNFPAPRFASRSRGYLAGERFPWTAAPAKITLITNSHMVRHAVIDSLSVPAGNVVVHYPGYDAARFNAPARSAHRTRAREELGIGKDEPLIGLVTSGNFEKRGLDRFLDCFTRLHEEHGNLRGLVVGGRHEPRRLASHPQRRSGRVVYRRVTPEPERCMAALDAMLYPARYEEFGIVVLEAMAMGIPVVTSTAVGAAELLVQASENLVLDAGHDDDASYRETVSELLRLDEPRRVRLEASLRRVAEQRTHDAHNARLAALVDRIK